MAVKSMQELMVEELREIYSAERLALRAYPRLRKAIRTQSLRDAVTHHVEQTKEQVERLGQIFELMDARARAKTCHAMEGLVDEAQEHAESDLSPELLEVQLVADLQKIEHFEIAAYGAARAHADALGIQEAVELLEETLNEEKETDALLNQIATEEVNLQALPAPNDGGEEDEEEEGQSPRERVSENSSRQGSSKASKGRASQ